MTLGVTSSASADRDKIFSQELRSHAKSLDLVEVMPVGEWDFGQGIRRAKAQHFFWELSSKDFLPLGLNHPVVLGAHQTQLRTPQPFPPDLLKVFPQLTSWQWTLLDSDHAWMKRDWTVTTAWQKKAGPWLLEDATWKCSRGWLGLEELDRLQGWAVRLNSTTYWVASPSALPQNGVDNVSDRAQIKAIMNADVFGNEGRLLELQDILRHSFPGGEVNGLNVKMAMRSDLSPNKLGISCDQIDANTIGLCFPLSFLPEDLTGISQIFQVKG